MNVFTVGFAYYRNNRLANRSHIMIIADSEWEAREAFQATHPDGSNFHYEITYTTHTEA